MAYLSKFGDWTRAGVVLQGLHVNLFPAFRAQIMSDGEMIVETLQGHIDAQDLPWAPLSGRTVAIKGNSIIYIDTGRLRDSIKVRKVRSMANGITIFIGANPWTRSAGGDKMSDVMIWMEYGNSKQPPRPLIRPTWEEVEPIVRGNWEALLKDLVETGG